MPPYRHTRMHTTDPMPRICQGQHRNSDLTGDETRTGEGRMHKLYAVVICSNSRDQVTGSAGQPPRKSILSV